MTNGTTTNGIGDPAMDKDHAGPEWVATSYSDHAKGCNALASGKKSAVS